MRSREVVGIIGYVACNEVLRNFQSAGFVVLVTPPGLGAVESIGGIEGAGHSDLSPLQLALPSTHGHRSIDSLQTSVMILLTLIATAKLPLTGFSPYLVSRS